MMIPYLIVVTGEPGAGKTTFAIALAGEACLPLICRDQIKEGCVHTWERSSLPVPEDANLIATKLFFQVITQMLEGGCSLIAEAAFQHKLWSPYLEPLMETARIRICLCAPDTREIAHERFLQRGLSDSRRIRFHNDFGVELARQGKIPVFTEYDPPHLNVPTYRINTTGEYDPPLSTLIPLLMDDP